MVREDRCQWTVDDTTLTPLLPPTDLMYMAAIAEEVGGTCRIKDYTLDTVSEKQFINDLKEFQPDYLVINTTTPTICQDLRSCTIAKKHIPNIQTIAKGAHFLKFNTEILKEHPDLDIIIKGEPEIPFKKIISGQDKHEINGLTWRDAENIIQNSNHVFVEDLDLLPFPARHLIDNSRYVRPDNNKPVAVIKVSRGCPCNCFFCLASSVSGSKVRLRSTESIITEISHCIKKYHIHDFLFWADIFSYDKNWVLNLCNAIIESNLNIRWAANTKVGSIDQEMAMRMKQAGCRLLSVGVESGNQDILDKIGKKTTIYQIQDTFQIIKKAHLTILAYYIIGLPWETKDTIEDTICLATKLDSDFAKFHIATPFPGTRFFDYALATGLFKTIQSSQNPCSNPYIQTSVNGHYLSTSEIALLQHKAIKAYFFRIKYFVDCLKKITSWRELCNYSKAAFVLFKNTTFC